MSAVVIVSDGPSGEEPSHHTVTEEPTRKGYYRIKYTPTAHQTATFEAAHDLVVFFLEQVLESWRLHVITRHQHPPVIGTTPCGYKLTTTSHNTTYGIFT